MLRQRKSSWWSYACVELNRPHSSGAEYTLKAARDGTQRGNWSIPSRSFRLLLLIGNVLKRTLKLSRRVIIFIYKLVCQECKKRHRLDIFMNSFELWMNMTKLHRQHFVFFTPHKNKHRCLFFIIVIIKNMLLISYHGARGPERCMTDVAYQFNLTLLQQYELTWKYFYL